MINNELLWFMLVMGTMNIFMGAYLNYIFKYHVKALEFLRHVKKLIIQNDEQEQLNILTRNDIPTYTETMLATKGMIYFVYATFNLNAVVFLLSLLPEIQASTQWMYLSWVMIGSNAFIMVSIGSFIYLKNSINATCESYNVLIQSYEYMKECEDNNGSTKR